jgi:hypothetical protein
MRLLIAFSLSVLLSAPSSLLAQNLAAIQNEMAALAKAATPGDRETALDNLIGSADKVLILDTSRLPTGIAEDGMRTIQEILATRRADVQTGSGSGASGSTSAVAGPLLPAIFGVAVEDGAITRTVSGTTISMKVNPVGLICAAQPGIAAAVARRDDEACRTRWRRVAFSISFDAGRGERRTELVGFGTLGNQFSEAAARVELINHRKATGERFQRVFATELEAERARAQAFVDRNQKLAVDLVQLGVQDDLESRLVTLTEAPTWATLPEATRMRAIEGEVRAALARAAGIDQAALDEQRRLWVESLRANRRLQNAIANAAVLTGEYAYRRADIAAADIGTIVPRGERPPGLHALTFVYARGWAESQLDLTSNLGITFFDQKREGMTSAFRDVRLAIEGKFRLPELGTYGSPTLSFAGLYQFLNQEPLGLGIRSFTGVVIKERGHIGLFQMKFEFPAANNTIRIPLSFSASNRTELIREADVRGQFGVSFNLDALFAPTVAPR